MTIAEVHGKISSTGRNLHDQMEDLLTSDVFSACKYLRPTTLLVPFLKKARSLNDESPLVPNQIHCATYHFWPRLARFEPDVLIALERDDRIWMVLIEAKYLSGKSGGPMDEEELSIASAPSDQLAGEYYDLLTAEDRVGLPPDRIVSRALIYMTAHRSMPTEDLQRSIAEASHFISEDRSINIYWLSWFDLMPILRETNAKEWELPILEDLQRLLEHKGFVRFEGFHSLEKIQLLETLYSFDFPHSSTYSFQLNPIDSLVTIYRRHGHSGTRYFRSLVATDPLNHFYKENLHG